MLMPSVDQPHAVPRDMAECRAILKEGSRSFFAASHLLPVTVRDPVAALYAFCRVTDDAVDLETAGRNTLTHLHRRLDAIYAGRPQPFSSDRAMADVVCQFALPQTIPSALLDGFSWDADGRRYETLADVEAYAARVAGTVGVMMAIVMGEPDKAALSRACDLGVAMQLTNIARDVGEDGRNGRLYLPRTWLREAGVDPDDWLGAPDFSPAIGAVTKRLLERAAILYRRGQAGTTALPGNCRAAIRAAGLIYAEIGAVIARNGFDSVSQRAVVPGRRKLQLLAVAATPRRGAIENLAGETVASARFLVDAVEPEGWAVPDDAPWWAVHRRWARMLEIMEAGVQRQQAMIGQASGSGTRGDLANG